MRVLIETDLDEFSPGWATIDIWWDGPPVSVKERWLPLHDNPSAVVARFLGPEIFVDMQDPDDPGGVRPRPYDDAA